MNAVSIPLDNLALAFLPAVLVVAVYIRWSLDWRNACWGLARMLMQLLAIGYVLTYIFNSDRAAVVLSVLLVMLLAASWIALRTVAPERTALFWRAMLCVTLVGGATLALVTQVVLGVEPWYSAPILISLAGMIFANAMTAVSLAAERFVSETAYGKSMRSARMRAFDAAMIPITNGLFAVGLVSLPGMMTGQILSGVSPLIAVRYQIMVMCMIFGAAGLTAALFLLVSEKHLAAATAAGRLPVGGQE